MLLDTELGQALPFLWKKPFLEIKEEKGKEQQNLFPG